MSTLSVTSKGQVTLRKELLRHIGVTPGEKIEVDLIPGGTITMRAVRRAGKIQDLYGVLKHTTKKKLTIEEMNQVIADGWAGKL